MPFTTSIHQMTTLHGRRALQFPGLCLGETKRAGKKSRSGASIVNGRLRQLREGQEPTNIPEARQSRSKEPSHISGAVASKLLEMDVRGAVRLLSSDDKLLSSTPDTLSKLQEKHPGPHRNTSWPLPPENPDPMICTRDDIKNAIKSFRNGAGAGPDGLRPGHLKQLTADILGCNQFTGRSGRLCEQHCAERKCATSHGPYFLWCRPNCPLKA